MLIAELLWRAVTALGPVVEAMGPPVLGLLERVPRQHVVALEDGEPGAYVPQRDLEVDDPVDASATA